jgi:hypothetical protein
VASFLLAEIADTTVPLQLTVDREGEGGLTALTPTVAIRDAATTDYYLDFDDNQFKTSGWVTKYQAMTHVERGLYTYILDLNALSVSAGQFLSAEYYVNESGVVGVDNDLILPTTAVYSLAPDGTQLQEIHRLLGLDPEYPLVVSRTQRSVGDISQTIETDVPVAGSVTVTRD